MNRVRTGAACAFLAAAWVLVLVVVAGAHRHGYSHVSQYISELGQRGSSDGWWVSWLGFFPVGVLAAAASLLVQPALKTSRLVAIGVAAVGISTFVGYAGSAVWRCDPGCPETGGSSTQDLHYFVSALDFVGVLAGFVCTAMGLRGRRQWRALFRLSVLGAVGIGGVGPFLTGDALMDVHGLVQRVLEAIVWCWFIALGLRASSDESVEPDRLVRRR